MRYSSQGVAGWSLTAALLMALAAGCWLAACSPAPRRLALPLLAIPATALALWPLYLLAAATARSVVVRLAAGAAGPVAVALASGLRGNPSALSEEATGVGLAGRVAGADDVVAVSRALLEAAGAGLAIQALLWALLALAARPLVALDGARLRFAGAVWLAAAAAGTVLGPALVGGPRVPFVPTAVAVILAAILLGIRSVVPTAGRNPGRGRGHAAP